MAFSIGSQDGKSIGMSLIARLTGLLGTAHVLTDPDVCAGYSTDWTGRFVGVTPAVLRPATTEQVAEAVRLCHEHGQPLVIQGGNTGLVGGAVPHGELILSTTRLQRLEVGQGELTVSAGVTLAKVHQQATTFGHEFGVDLAARDSATIGGMVSTNAGGLRVVRHGQMRAQVLGLEFVLPDGSIVDRLHPPAQDSSGYDLPGLIIGAEGTLAIVTAVRLRLVRPSKHHTTALLSIENVDTALKILSAARGSHLSAAEIFFDPGMQLVRKTHQLPQPVPETDTYLLLEFDHDDDIDGKLSRTIADHPAAIATDPSTRAKLWSYREEHATAINSVGIPVKLDVAVPLAEFAAFEQNLRTLFATEFPTAHPINFGHFAQGALHVNVLNADEQVVRPILNLVAAHHGTISAEHGVGQAKSTHLHLTRSPAELTAYRGIKHALDPTGILNPTVMLPYSQPRLA
jgi:FAD/FMN-containing dehydrogenase